VRRLSNAISAPANQDQYERLFDDVRRKMRAWEQANLGAKESQAPSPREAAPEEFQY
jgi:hypothetical protein